MALTTPLDSEIAEEHGMIADQSTQTTPPQPRVQAFAAIARLLARHPQLAARDDLDFAVARDGVITPRISHKSAERVLALYRLATALGLSLDDGLHYTHEGTPYVVLGLWGDFDGAHWSVSIHVREDAGEFAAFTDTHNPDPQEWTDAERAEYAALAGTAAAA